MCHPGGSTRRGGGSQLSAQIFIFFAEIVFYKCKLLDGPHGVSNTTCIQTYTHRAPCAVISPHDGAHTSRIPTTTHTSAISRGHGGHIPYPALCTGHGGRVPYPAISTGEEGRIPYPALRTGHGGRVPYPAISTGEKGRIPHPAISTGEEGRIPAFCGDEGKPRDGGTEQDVWHAALKAREQSPCPRV